MSRDSYAVNDMEGLLNRFLRLSAIMENSRLYIFTMAKVKGVNYTTTIIMLCRIKFSDLLLV